jgi:hypothetical protein
MMEIPAKTAVGFREWFQEWFNQGLIANRAIFLIISACDVLSKGCEKV